jgi:tape measure domain-containing protein
MANDGFIEFLSPNALAELKQAQALVDSLALKIEQISKFKAPSTPSGVNSASKQIIDDLKVQEQAIKQTTNALIQEEKVKQQVLATEIKQSNAIKANVAQREAQRKAALAQQQADEKAAKAAERNALANERLNDAYSKLNSQRNQAARTLQNLIASETASNAEIRKAQKEFDTLNNKVKKADQAVGNFSRNVGNYGSALSGATQLMGAFGIATGVYLAADLVKNIFQTTKELQSLDLALKMVSETQDKYAANTSFVRELSEKWGIEIKGLTEQFTQFYVNAKGKLSEDAIRKSFEGIAKAGALMGISIDKQNDAFYAFNQMLSKGTVQAEELKKQLGNALPGAIKAATMAYQELNPNLKVTEQMMLDQMKAGKLISNEMVPAIIRAYQKLYGIENVNAVDTLAAAQNRLSNSWTAMVKAMNEGSTSGVSKFFNIILTGLTNILTLTGMLFKDEKQLQEYFQSVGASQAGQELDSYREKFKTFEEETRTFMDSEFAEKQRQNIKMQLQIIKEQQAVRKTILGGDRALFHLQTKIEEDALVSLGKSRAILNLLKKEAEPVTQVTPNGSGGSGSSTNKKQKERIDLNYEEVKSLYDLEIARRKEQQVLQKEIMDNQDAPDYTRLEARKEYSRLAVEILDKQYKKEQALALDNLTDNLNKAEQQYQKNIENGYNDVKNNEEFAKAKADIEATFLNETELALINHSRNWQNLMYEDADFNEKIRKATFDKEEKLRKKTIEEVRKLNQEINKSEQNKYLKIANDESKTLKTRQAAFQEYQKLALQQIDLDQQADLARATPEEYDGIIFKYKELADAIKGLESPLDVANEKMKDFLRNSALDTISKGLDKLGLNSLKIFTDIDRNGQTTFSKLFEAAKTSGEQFAVVFETVGNVFQDVMNMMMEASNRRFEAEKQKLQEETEIALAFAGESDSARAEIERQAEKRRKEIAAREFKAKKKQAIFNIAIDTAQAIISIWAQVPKVDFGVSAGLLSAFVGALGAAQIAMVSSQEVPAFKDGGVHDGGLMLVNDAKGSNFRETIKTPDGKLYQPKGRNVLMNAPKGTEIFTPDQWQKNLDSMLMSNNISYAQPNINVNGGGITDAQVNKIVSTIQNKQEYHQTFDRNGIKNYISNGHTTKEILNNQVTFGR